MVYHRKIVPLYTFARFTTWKQARNCQDSVLESRLKYGYDKDCRHFYGIGCLMQATIRKRHKIAGE